MKNLSFKFILFLSVFLVGSSTFYSYAFQLKPSSDSLAYYDQLIRYPHHDEDLTEAYTYFLNDKMQASAKNDSLKVVYDLTRIASIENKVGYYLESETTSVEALRLLSHLSKTEYTTVLEKSLYAHLGIIYRELRNTEKALELYNKSLNMATSTEDSLIIYNNISNLFKDNSDFTSASEYLLKAELLLPRAQDSLTKARVLDNLGFVKSKLHNENGLDYMLSAMQMREAAKDIIGLYASHRNLSEYYKDRGLDIRANEFANKAYGYAKLTGSATYKEDALALLLDLNYDDNVREYRKLSDSINLTKKRSLNKFALMKYDVSEKERQFQESELRTKQEQFRSALYLIIIIFVLILSVVFYYLLIARHKKKNLQQVYDTEFRISKKVHDEVANDIYHVMTKLQDDSNNMELVLDDLEDVYNKTRDISKEHSAINVKENYDELIEDLLLSYKNNEVNIIARNISKIDWNSLSEIKKTTIYRILQELMTNMRKHSQATLVVLNFDQVGKKIQINYSDNGIGGVLNKQNGLQNTENRITSINGTITFETQINHGFKAKIVL